MVAISNKCCWQQILLLTVYFTLLCMRPYYNPGLCEIGLARQFQSLPKTEKVSTYLQSITLADTQQSADTQSCKLSKGWQSLSLVQSWRLPAILETPCLSGVSRHTVYSCLEDCTTPETLPDNSQCLSWICCHGDCTKTHCLQDCYLRLESRMGPLYSDNGTHSMCEACHAMLINSG